MHYTWQRDQRHLLFRAREKGGAGRRKGDVKNYWHGQHLPKRDVFGFAGWTTCQGTSYGIEIIDDGHALMFHGGGRRRWSRDRVPTKCSFCETRFLLSAPPCNAEWIKVFERPWLDLCVGLSSLFSFLFLFIQWVNAGGLIVSM